MNTSQEKEGLSTSMIIVVCIHQPLSTYHVVSFSKIVLVKPIRSCVNFKCWFLIIDNSGDSDWEYS